jgi:cobalt-zinc-cadmium resistance protein CzcA
MTERRRLLESVVEWSLAHRILVLVGTAVVGVSGVVAFLHLPIDAFPDTTPVQVQINTVSPTLSPEEVERQLTVPIEQVVAGLPKVEELRSISKFGLSQITLRFSDDVSIWFARQVVTERLGAVHLPDGVAAPTLGPVATGLGEVFHYVVRGKGKTLEELRTVHDWQIAPQLRSVPGVAEVNAWGGNEKQWQVVVDPRRLQKFDLSLGDVALALEANNANVGGGFLTRGGAARPVIGVGMLANAGDVADVVVSAREGVPVRVRDLGRVEVGHEVKRAAFTLDGEGEAVMGLGFMLMGENSHVVTTALAQRLEDVAKGLPAGIEVAPLYERTLLVDQVLHTVRNSLFEGALLVIAVLLLFLGNLRAGLVVASAIPLSMLFAFNGMLRLGVAGTLMSLGAIDFGLIVDGSVILVENVERRLGLDGGRRPVIDVVRDAAVEVVRPMLSGGLIITVVYAPLLFLEGIEGKMFRPMAITAILALVGAMVLSATLMPVLASFAFRRGRHAAREPLLVRVLKRVYAPVLDRALAHPRVVLGGAGLLLVGAVVVATHLGSAFVPRLSEGSIVVNTVRLAEVSLEESVRYGSRLEALLMARFPGEIAHVWTRTGTPEVATDPMGVEVSDVFITLKPRDAWTTAKTQEELVAEMEKALSTMPGMNFSFSQPIEMRVNEMIAGVRGDLAIKLFGDDLDILKSKAQEIESVVRQVQGAADVSIEQVTGVPVTKVVVDRAAASRYGIDAREVLEVVEALGGREVGEVLEGERRFPLAVRLPESFRDEEVLAALPVTAPDGVRVPLGRLVRFVHEAGPTVLQREWGKRRTVVQVNVRERDLGGFVDEVRERLSTIELPEGYWLRYGGQFENLDRARLRLAIVVPGALLLIFGLLFLTYRRVVDALRVFSGVPLALIGGVLALWLRDLPFSISAAVGFIALSGVSVLDDMVMVSRIRQLLDEGRPQAEAIREAALSRLRPVLMTSTVASLGFLPMALNTGVGAEVQRPLATVVIGGMVSATLLTLVVLPVLYGFVSRRPQEKSL